MQLFLLVVATISLVISKIALFMYLINSFKMELSYKLFGRDLALGRLPSRKTTAMIHERDQLEIRRGLIEIQTLMWTIGIGEIVGHVFLTLTAHPHRIEIILLNAIYLIIASLMCQMLTLLNAWFKVRTYLFYRVALQSLLLIFGCFLISLVDPGYYDVARILLFMVLAFFTTSIIALITMLLDGLFFDPGNRSFDYNHYTRLVILLGLIIGSSLYYHFSLSLIY